VIASARYDDLAVARRFIKRLEHEYMHTYNPRTNEYRTSRSDLAESFIEFQDCSCSLRVPAVEVDVDPTPACELDETPLSPSSSHSIHFVDYSTPTNLLVDHWGINGYYRIHTLALGTIIISIPPLSTFSSKTNHSLGSREWSWFSTSMPQVERI
jgi:hypothetical protein